MFWGTCLYANISLSENFRTHNHIIKVFRSCCVPRAAFACFSTPIYFNFRHKRFSQVHFITHEHIIIHIYYPIQLCVSIYWDDLFLSQCVLFTLKCKLFYSLQKDNQLIFFSQTKVKKQSLQLTKYNLS